MNPMLPKAVNQTGKGTQHENSTRHEERLVRGADEGRSLLRRIASLILLFNGLLVAWVLLKPGSDAVVAIVVNAAEFVGPLLVLPLCFGGLRRLWRRGISRPHNAVAVITRPRWAPVPVGLSILALSSRVVGSSVLELG